MSKYTTEVRFICEELTGLKDSVGYNDVDSVIQKAIPLMFNFEFPMFDEAYRNVLCTKILRHYYTREISEEVYGLWKLRLEAKLNEIMPYYNQLYLTTLYKFDPFHDVDYTVTHEGSRAEQVNRAGDGTAVGKSESVNGGGNTVYDLYSDTPQGSLQNVDNETYLTNARKTITSLNETNTTDTNNSNKYNEDTKLNNTDQYIETVKGKRNVVSYSTLLQEFRKTLLNIDMDIINDLSDLFFGLW